MKIVTTHIYYSQTPHDPQYNNTPATSPRVHNLTGAFYHGGGAGVKPICKSSIDCERLTLEERLFNSSVND
jgi:hypothetical protein